MPFPDVMHSWTLILYIILYFNHIFSHYLRYLDQTAAGATVWMKIWLSVLQNSYLWYYIGNVFFSSLCDISTCFWLTHGHSKYIRSGCDKPLYQCGGKCSQPTKTTYISSTNKVKKVFGVILQHVYASVNTLTDFRHWTDFRLKFQSRCWVVAGLFTETKTICAVLNSRHLVKVHTEQGQSDLHHLTEVLFKNFPSSLDLWMDTALM